MNNGSQTPDLQGFLIPHKAHEIECWWASVDLSMWIILGTIRQLLSRLPLLPNKDVVFAGVAAFLIGRDSDIVSAMALMATLILAAHLVVGLLLGMNGLIKDRT